MNDSITYPGAELALFRHARNWKKYFAKEIRKFIKGDVLENGAGIGATTLILNISHTGSWTMTEPDAGMFATLQQMIFQKELQANCEVHHGTIDTVTRKFDTVIYIDVLEHIEADASEMKKASDKLHPGGHLIVLSPAFAFLYGPFDKAIGHYRRYTKNMLHDLTPGELELISARYYDTMGFFAALVNKLFLRQRYPSIKQVKFWDRWMVPVSTITDNIFFHTFGKTIIGVWRKKMDS